MRLYFCLLLTAFVTTTAVAQPTIDYDDIVAPADATPRTFEDYIVQRAWYNNASTQILDANVESANLEKTAAKRSWIDQINANINIASQRDTINGFFNQGEGRNSAGQLPTNADGSLVNNQYLRPGFNYGLAFNLGGLINNKLRVRRAEQDVIIAKLEQNQEKLQFRAMVLDRLEQFDNSRELLTIRRNAEIDAETNYTLVQSLYDQGKAQFEDLAQASEVYFRSVEATSLAKSRVKRTRLRVEEMVGEPFSKLEEVREKMSVRKR